MSTLLRTIKTEIAIPFVKSFVKYTLLYLTYLLIGLGIYTLLVLAYFLIYG